MAKLLERVEHHLRRVQRIESSQVVDAEVPPDFGGHEATLIAQHEQYVAADRSAAERIDRKWERDLRPHQLEHFVDELHWRLLAVAGGVWRQTRGTGSSGFD